MPVARLEVVRPATPPLNVPVPRLVEPSINVTVPVAADGLTTAVNVTGVLNWSGFAEDETVVEEPCLTVCVNLDEVLVL